MSYNIGKEMHDLCKVLFPICRSITGNGFRDSLAIINEHLPDLTTFEISSGTKCFDWEVPQEWNIKEAYIIDPFGKKLCDFNKSNLHVVGYSTPVNKDVPLDVLQNHLYSLPDQPDAIPYVTSYYNKMWGFCISDQERKTLKKGNYKVFIDSELKKGSLTYGELIINGKKEDEIFISTYLCHPSMANNELSGPVVSTFLSKWLSSISNNYTYRIIFIPETIGAIVYLSQHLDELKRKVIAGFNLTCIGDNRTYSYLSSRMGDSLADKAALHVLKHIYPDFNSYSYSERQCDLRQYGSPGVDLPVCSIMRSKYGSYPEYHTSLDNLNLVTPDGLSGGYDVMKKIIEVIERNQIYRTTVYCEPNLGKRGLYPTVSKRKSADKARPMRNILAYSDGSNSLLDIANILDTPMWQLMDYVNTLCKERLLEFEK
jgi:aminopeptidase-like protein